MVVVEPIRNRDDVQLMIEWLTLHSAVKESDRQRNLMLFLSGVNLGFRIGDIVKLKVKHVKGWHVQIVDEKTDKPTKRKMPKKFKNAMRQYIKDKKDEDFLFPSRNGKHQHIKPNTAYKIIKRAAEEVGLENIATHSMRKTFGFIMYEQTKDVALIMGPTEPLKPKHFTEIHRQKPRFTRQSHDEVSGLLIFYFNNQFIVLRL